MVRIALLVVATTTLLFAEDRQQGVPARPSAAEYASQAQWQNVTFAASLIPAKQVEHLFAFDISRSFVVFEVACFADSSAALKLSPEGFVVKTKATADPVHRSAPETVASAIERQNQPSFPSSRGLSVDSAATIGIAHGNDPYSGRPNTGVYTGGQVGVENGRPDRMPPPDLKPGTTPEDRVMLAAQLRARSVPDGLVNGAVAGYVYFRKADIKPQPDGTCQLQYLAEENGTGVTHAISMAVPAKSR